MKVFENIEEMQPYYNEEDNTYRFYENQTFLDVKFDFDLHIDSDIYARDVIAKSITARNIDACDIKTGGIKANNIDAHNIRATDITARNIKARDISAGGNIDAQEIIAEDINARDIDACDIDAANINFYAVCFAYNTFVCQSIKGRRGNAKYFCLDTDVAFKQPVEHV